MVWNKKNIAIHNFYGNISFFSSLLLSIPTSFFIASLAFFLVIVLKRGGFAFLLFFSYVYVENISKGMLTKKLQIFINYYGINYNNATIKANRIVIIALGFLLLISAIKRTSRA